MMALDPPSQEYIEEELDGIHKALIFILQDAQLKRQSEMLESTEGSRYIAEMKCPECGTGIITYTAFGPKLKVWGKCSTSGCVTWIE